MKSRTSITTRLWRTLTRAKPSQHKSPAKEAVSKAPNPGPQIPEEGGLPDYERYCRIALGDKFNNDRYTVLRKLGYGQYSTVWLALDSKMQNHVALKVLRSDCYDGTYDIYELELLKHIQQKSQSSTNPGRNRIIPLLDHFDHKGTTGSHVCFVFPVLGSNLGLQTSRYEKYRIPVAAVKEVSRQLLQGLDFLHRECGIIHTDLKPTNMLLELEDPETAITTYLEQETLHTFKPKTEESRVVTPLSETITTPLISELNEIRVRIIDLGVSSWVDKHLAERIQSPLLRAPEVTLGAPWSTGVDIFSLGCVIWELVKGHYSFAGTAAEDGSYTAEDDRLAQMIEVFGPFPKNLLKRGDRTKEFFDKQGNLLRIKTLKPTTMLTLMDGPTEALQRPKDMPQSEVPIFANFLEGMLAVDPDKRKSAAEMLKHPWLNM